MEAELYQYQTIVSCSLCSEPLVILTPTGETYSRTFIHFMTRPFCKTCAEVVGLSLTNLFIDRYRSMTYSLN